MKKRNINSDMCLELSDIDFSGVYKKSCELSRIWFVGESGDYSLQNGYSLGELTQYTMQAFFSDLLYSKREIDFLRKQLFDRAFVFSSSEKSFTGTVLYHIIDDSFVNIADPFTMFAKWQKNIPDSFNLIKDSIRLWIKKCLKIIVWILNLQKIFIKDSNKNLYIPEINMYIPDTVLKTAFENQIQIYCDKRNRTLSAEFISKIIWKSDIACAEKKYTGEKFSGCREHTADILKKAVGNNIHPDRINAIVSRIHCLFDKTLCEIKQTEYILKKNRITGVILFADVLPQQKTTAYVARKIGISTVCFQHGIISDNFSVHGYLPVSSDYIGVIGRRDYEWFKNHGVADNRIFRAGIERNVDEIPQISGIQNKRIILFPISYFADNERETGPGSGILLKKTMQAVDCVSHLENVLIILKHHPNNPDQKFMTAVLKKKYTGKNILVDPPGKTSAYIGMADLIVTQISTVITEGIAEEKRIINYEFWNPEYFHRFSDERIMNTSSLKEFSECINRWYNGKLPELKGSDSFYVYSEKQRNSKEILLKI